MNASPKSNMMAARSALVSLLDAKLSDVPEWQAFRAVDRAIAALEASSNGVNMELPATAVSASQTKIDLADIAYVAHDGSHQKIIKTYVGLAKEALHLVGKPLPTASVIEYIRKRRPLNNDIERMKMNVTSALSKDARFRNIPWDSGRAWWFVDREIPTEGN